jgi:hypothetical protein
MHEFEALLFSEPLILAEKLHVEPQCIRQILAECGSPEEINDNPATAPSKRISALMRGYQKIAMGKKIAETTGLAVMRRQCPHFDSWLKQLEQLPKGL